MGIEYPGHRDVPRIYFSLRPVGFHQLLSALFLADIVIDSCRDQLQDDE